MDLIDEGLLKNDLQTLYGSAGAILQTCQGSESLLKLLLGILHSKGQINLQDEDYDAILENRSRTTMGQVITILRTNVSLGNEEESCILEALKYRNYIIHRFFNDHVEHFFNHERCLNIIEELQRMGKVIWRADDLLWNMFFQVTKVFGFTPENYWPEVKSNRECTPYATSINASLGMWGDNKSLQLSP